MKKTKYDSGYPFALEMAGAEVLTYQQFGSYQGDWWALVRYNGNVAWVHDYYGSCSGCDAYEAELGYASHQHGDEYVSHWEFPERYDKNCEECLEYERKIIEFGKRYLGDLLSQDEAEKKCAEDISWDSDAEDALRHIIGYGIIYNLRPYSDD